MEDHAPTIDDLIIPHPSFELRDIVTFELLDPTITEQEEAVAEGASSIDDSMIPEIREIVDSYVNSSTPIPSSYSNLFSVLSSLFDLWLATSRTTMVVHSHIFILKSHNFKAIVC